MIGGHDGHTGARIRHENFCAQHFCVLRLLAHAKRVLILAEHVVDEHDSVVLDA